MLFKIWLSAMRLVKDEAAGQYYNVYKDGRKTCLAGTERKMPRMDTVKRYT